MKPLPHAFAVCAALGLCPAAAFASSGNQLPAPTDEQVQHTLQSMSANSTEGHPDLHGQFEGMLRYEKGDYAGAMKYFISGARYADKASQLCIGLLYLNGQGAAKDPATAYAWIALSAERNYPQFVATRNNVWAKLDASQREKATQVLKQLMAEYGDAVAKPRLFAIFQQEKLHMTGSPAGFEGFLATGTLAQFATSMGATGSSVGDPAIPGFGAAGLYATGVLPRCDLDAVEGGVVTCCGDFWGDSRWKSNLYFQSTDRFWKATVNVGPLLSTGHSSVATRGSPPNGSAGQVNNDNATP